jgi:hypothetical protein
MTPIYSWAAANHAKGGENTRGKNEEMAFEANLYPLPIVSRRFSRPGSRVTAKARERRNKGIFVVAFTFLPHNQSDKPSDPSSAHRSERPLFRA